MEAPTSFVKRLSSEFPLLRIRWSDKRECWQIEQQVGRGCLPPIRLDPFDDNLIRAKDGYWLVCEVRPGTTMPCPTCGCKLDVPALEFKEVRCDYCILNKKDGRHVAGYFPLGETLLEHLRSTDPLRGALERMAKQADEANKKMMAAAERATSNVVEAATKDAFHKLVGIPSVGYTGNNKTIHFDKDF